jgi:hypothetical protein
LQIELLVRENAALALRVREAEAASRARGKPPVFRHVPKILLVLLVVGLSASLRHLMSPRVVEPLTLDPPCKEPGGCF